MKCYNNGESVIIKASFLEAATIKEILQKYILENPKAWDLHLVRELLGDLESPEVVDGLEITRSLDSADFDNRIF